MRRLIAIVMILALALVALACGDQTQSSNPADIPRQTQPQEDTVKKADVLGEWRRDAGRFEGGEFSFTHGEETYSTELGYAEFRRFERAGNSRILLLNTPLSSGNLPMLRVTVTAEMAGAEEFIGQMVETDRFNLKLEKKKTTQGAGSVTFTAISEGFIEGTFTAEMDDGKKLEGSFRAKLNRAADAD